MNIPILKSSYFSNFDHVTELLIRLTNKYNICIAPTTINQKLISHPNHPSLLSISDSLNTWKIENVATLATFEEIVEFEFPFIAYLSKNGGQFVLIEETEQTKIVFFDGIKRSTLEKDEFHQLFSGYILIANPNSESGEPNCEKNKKSFYKNFYYLTALVISFFILINTLTIAKYSSAIFNPVMPILLSILYSAGLLTSIVLLWYQVDKKNNVIGQFCNGAKNINCAAVLDSSYNKILGFISWSEVGFLYFTLNLVTLLIFPEHLNLILKLNIISIAFVPYSIYTQWALLKNWCTLCLFVQVILAVTAFLGILFINQVPDKPLTFIDIVILTSTIGIILISTSFIWKILVHKYEEAHQAKALKVSLNRLKFDKDLVQQQLTAQADFSGDYSNLGITIGEISKPPNVMMICSLFCSPCKDAYFQLREIISNNENIKARIIFAITHDAPAEMIEVVKLFLGVEQISPQNSSKYLTDWYNSDRNATTYLAKNANLNFDPVENEKSLNNMIKWCTQAKIQFTPTVYVNGYQLPTFYEINDIPNLLEVLN